MSVSPESGTARTLRFATTSSLVALIVLALAWELWLAPLRPGGSWLALKAVPLLPAFAGIAKGRAYTHQWSMMLVLAYFTEGCVRAYAERAPSATLALLEIVLSGTFFVTSIAYVRARR